MAAWIIFLSLIEPPGWIIAFTPDFANSSIPSLKGKKPSDAATELIIFSGTNFKAFWLAILQLSNLLGWPEPIPIVDWWLTKTIALDFTNLQILNANFKLLSCLNVGFFLDTIFNLLLKSTLFVSCARKLFPKKL